MKRSLLEFLHLFLRDVVVEDAAKLFQGPVRSLRIEEEYEYAGDHAEADEDEIVPAVDRREERRGDECYDKVANPVRGRGEGHPLCSCAHRVDLRTKQPWSRTPA